MKGGDDESNGKSDFFGKVREKKAGKKQKQQITWTLRVSALKIRSMPPGG